MGTNWHKLGYKSFDYESYAPAILCDIYRWLVMAGHRRTFVAAATLDEAKDVACAKRGWRLTDITETRRIPPAGYTKD
jgi:hypothetical protein